ncbi:hypothetical protein ACL6C3_14440 [Capilliphycus salinus ALCB114379]|uniref:hypothetical protein n=1 Tax=Capilliphycus salinus TaxID=2768948 RepID=UPI0039A708FB
MKLRGFSQIIDADYIARITNNSKPQDSGIHQAIGSFILAFMLATGIATATERQRVVPAQFQGEWSDNLESCGSRGSQGQLFMSPDRIEFYESSGPISEIVTHGKFDLELTVELSGEGQTWLSNRYFRLSDDRKSLTDITNGNPGFVRYRCP